MIASVGFSASLDAGNGLEPFVELVFPVQGKYLPADHNYGLYAACVHLIPEIRERAALSILTIPGIGDRQGKILLTEESCVRIRVPISQIPLVYQLAGKSICIGIHTIHIGIPEIFILKPASRLRSRIVTIKGYNEPESFLAAAQRQLDSLEISGQISIPVNQEGKPSRKTLKIKRYTVVGFTTEVSGLSDEHSLKLLQCGIGGKRHLGCGYFLPHKGR
ncbi:type I-MYXAN CRISPR-associated protein Cas6/Cmx6 [Scytonema sp. NUACC21]